MTRESLKVSSFDGARQDCSELSMDSGYSSTQANGCKTGLNWIELMRVESGGPGESPGRSEAIERAKARIRQRQVMRDVKRGVDATLR